MSSHEPRGGEERGGGRRQNPRPHSASPSQVQARSQGLRVQGYEGALPGWASRWIVEGISGVSRLRDRRSSSKMWHSRPFNCGRIHPPARLFPPTEKRTARPHISQSHCCCSKTRRAVTAEDWMPSPHAPPRRPASRGLELSLTTVGKTPRRAIVAWDLVDRIS
jgi:hypothetical protein